MFAGHYGPSFAVKTLRPASFAVTALVFYVVFALVAEWLAHQRRFAAA